MPRFLRLVLLIAGSVCLLSPTSQATNFYTYISAATDGAWNVAGTWTTDPSGVSLTGSAVPANGDAVFILNGFRVFLTANVATTGLSVTINNGGTLDLATHTMAPLAVLAGSGTLKIGSGYFPVVTTNTFVNNAATGATVEYADFTGTVPASLNFPNLRFTNATASNHTISLSNADAYTLNVYGSFTTQITASGTLTVTIGTQLANVISLVIRGNVSIGAGTSWGVASFNRIHNVSIAGDMTNNGTVDFSNGTQYAASASGAVNISFIGASNNILACNSTTDLYTLTVDKGTSSTYILSVTSTNVANLNFYSNGILIDVVNGTLRLGVNINMSQINGSGNYELGSETRSPMLWIDGATVSTSGRALVVYGKFRITAGSFTTLGGEGSVIRFEGQYLIEGGTFTTEKFRPSTNPGDHRGSFIMSGGTFNAQGTTGSNSGYARFSHPFEDQVFIMTGGTLNVSNPQSGGGGNQGGIHIGCKESNYTVTGGTVNAILSGSATAFRILSTAPLYRLNISRANGTTPATAILTSMPAITGMTTTAQPLRVLNDFTIDGTNSPVFDANGQDVQVGGNFTINTGASYTPNGNATIFNGTADQLFSNSGTITSGLYELTVDKPSGTLTLGGSATTYAITQTLRLSRGVLNDGGRTIQVTGDIINNATHTGTGSITLSGASPQLLSGNGNGIYGNIILNNGAAPGARATANLSISGVLTLAGTGNSLFDIDQYTLSMTSSSVAALATTGNPFGSAKMIRTLGLQSDGGIRKTYGNLNAFTYHVGTGTSYTPATIQLTATPTTYGSITVKPVNSRNPFVVAGNTNNLMYYWRVASSGFVGVTTFTHVYRYVESSVAPAGDDVNYVPGRYNPTTWTVINDVSQVNETTNEITFANVPYINGDFTAGVPAAFGIVKVFYSKRNGIWSNTGAGTTPWSNVSHTGPDATTAPTAGDHVYIGDGSTHNHTVNIAANNASCGGLEISSGSTLDVGVYTGHNFGALEDAPVGGSGTLRISSAVATAQFPAGDFGNFIRATGGTVVYYSTGGQDFTIPLASASPTLLPLITYRQLIIAPASGNYIAMPNQDVRIFGNLTIQGAALNATARLNAAAVHTLTINGNVNVNGGTLQFQNGTAQSVNVDGNIMVSPGAAFDVAAAGTAVSNAMLINGNLVNNGTFDMSVGTRHCNVTFQGTANTSITGTGSVTDFNILSVSKGASIAPVLEVDASNFSLTGGASPLVLSNGTFRLTSAQTVAFATGTDFNIPATARLSANGGTLQLTGGDGVDLLLAGTLEVLGGVVNVGTSANDNSIEYAATGLPTISVSGGELNVRAQVRRSSATAQGSLVYNQSGLSTVNVGISSALTNQRALFELFSSGSSFTMSGGVLRLQRATPATLPEFYLQPASGNVTGGTVEVEISTGPTAQPVDISTTIPLFNFNVTGIANTAARLISNALTLRGSLSISAGCIFDANSLNVTIAGNFTNANTTSTPGITNGGYLPRSITQTTTFNGSAANQNIAGVAGNLTNFANLVISNTFTGGIVAMQDNSNIRVNGNLTLTSGVLAGGTNTITAVATVSNASTHTSTTGHIALAGTAAQLITGNGSGRFGNVVLNNGAGAFFGANQEITGTLAFTAGALNIGSYGLNLSSTSLTSITGVAPLASPARYIITAGNLSDGGVTKAFASGVTAGNFEYPIGVTGKYTPANYTITTGGSGGTITIRPVNSKHPSATGSGSSFIRYYWSVVRSSNFVTALTHQYTYHVSDEAGTPADYRDARFIGGAWTVGVTAGNPDANRVITFTNINGAGDYTAGELDAFQDPLTYTTIASGAWESDGAVWVPDPPGTGIGPPQGSFVIISVGHTVTMSTDAKRIATLDIRGRLNLGTTTSHDFGTVSTTGAGERTVQLQSSLFPAGDFSAFNAAGGGTVEYDGAVNVSASQATYNNLAFTGAGTKILGNVDLTINGNVTINAGTVTNANNRNINMTSVTGDFTNHGIFNAGSGSIVVGRDLINSGTGVIFNGPNSTTGLVIARNLNNTANATFLAGTDSIGVRGSLTNGGTFNASTGAIRVSGNVDNTSGTFTSAAGIVNIGGSLTNNASFSGGSGDISVQGTFINSGASAVFAANANSLFVNGSVNITSGSVFNAGTGTITTNGNWNNSSTFNAGTGTINFTRTTDQDVVGATTFHHLSRNGGTLTLNDDMTATGLLSLSSGNVITGANTLFLTNTSTQPVTGYSEFAYIDGRLAVSYPGTAPAGRVYPVGSGAYYRPVTIQQTLTSTTPTVAVRMINTTPSGTFPDEVGTLSEARYYAIDLLSGAINAPTIDLSFNTNEPADEDVATPANARILRSLAPTGPWTNEGGTGVFNPAAPAGHATSGVTSVVASTFFALGYQKTPLPVSLVSFAARLNSDLVDLEWSTASESNNDYFTVERSDESLQFDSLFTVKGAGDSHMLLHYTATDYSPLYGVSFYRLKQTDYDLKYSYSKVVRVVNNNMSAPVLSLYPNPAGSADPIQLRVNSNGAGKSFVVITDLPGRVYYAGHVDLSTPVNLRTLSTRYHLAPGMYVIRVAWGSTTETRKFIIE